ncbi:uncharacterized protein CC84DRAFT_1209879 [Paraphaeosphaeria sporulosa]|uniref:Uncharacterized protein n=1 Tax=Paraphaeosphaeria sporulosa TaxID=1460663 RepID=A0A177BYM9_9PLEO|nr:uncharacterized protein CC84DRAFT_1209879 [Paraphaeosphaeria sporulosa]OAG00256.1 hypothetical protein CC84DRAFT_1209879 [Paraphaeosphaeria sporulosa]
MHSASRCILSLVLVIQSFGQQSFAHVNLGAAAPYGGLAKTYITDNGFTVVQGVVASYRAGLITNSPPGLYDGVNNGNATADKAHQDASAARSAAAALASTARLHADITGETFRHGVYTSAMSVGFSGVLRLDGENDPNSLFIFKIGASLTTQPQCRVILINGAQAFNGGLYALNGAVGLIKDQIIAQSHCPVRSSDYVSSTFSVRSSSATASNTLTSTSDGSSSTTIISAAIHSTVDSIIYDTLDTLSFIPSSRLSSTLS